MTLTAHSADSSPSSQALFTNMSSEVTTSKSDNVTALTPEMTFDREDAWNVAAYVSLFILSATLNSTVLTTLLCNNRSAKSHVNRFIIHLCTADLVVTFITMPLEVIWTITGDWRAGDVACRVLMFFRALGFYSSSFLLVTISLDRYFAIVHPFSRLKVANQRARLMITGAWVLAIIASAPQSVIFHTEENPNVKGQEHCVTFNAFPTARHEQAYNAFNVLSIFIIPLVIILVSYGLILWTVTIKSLQQQLCDATGEARLQGTLCSGLHRIHRARIRSIAMTLVIVIAFVTCWSPYYVMSVWYWLDVESAMRVNPLIQRALFTFAVASSCTNPIVYGMFTINFRREFQLCCVSGPCSSSACQRATAWCCCIPASFTHASPHQGNNSTVLPRHSVVSLNTLVTTSSHLRRGLTYLCLTERDKLPSSDTLFASVASSLV